MRALLLALLLLPGLARAQDCALGVGVAGGISPAGRDWDLSTPGPLATSASPVLSAQCTAAGAWVAVDASPWLRHSWRRLHARGPQLVSARIGAREGLYLVTNGPAWGVGLHGDLGDRVEVRLEWIGGANPDFQAWLVFGLGVWREVDEHDHHWLIGGFELGRLIGYRLELQPWERGPELGVRVGALTWLRSGTAVQPVAMGTFDIPWREEIELSLSLGATMREGAVEPIGGMAAVFPTGDGDAVELRFGALGGLGSTIYLTPDVGVSFSW